MYATESVQFDDIFLVYAKHLWFRCVPGILLHLMMPALFQGFRRDTYVATQNGKYGFYACTEYCPEQCHMLDPVTFVELNFGNWGILQQSGNRRSKS
jgi:hypothetical protein